MGAFGRRVAVCASLHPSACLGSRHYAGMLLLPLCDLLVIPQAIVKDESPWLSHDTSELLNFRKPAVLNI